MGKSGVTGKLITAIGAVTLTAFAVAQPPATESGASAELQKIVREDQSARQSGMPTTKDAIKKMIAEDRERRERAATLLRDDKLKTGEDFDNAALVFQHGETPDDFITAHELSVIAVLERQEKLAARDGGRPIIGDVSGGFSGSGRSSSSAIKTAK